MSPATWLLLGAGFCALACLEAYWQLRKGASLWRAFRTWLGKIVDIVSG